jgi:hypothetical protein
MLDFQQLPYDILNKIFLKVLDFDYMDTRHFINKLIKIEDIELLNYMLNNVDILELNKRYKINFFALVTDEIINFNSLLMVALKHNKLKTFILISKKFPEYDQIFIINWVFRDRIRKNKTLEYILNNPNNETIEYLKYKDQKNFKIYYDDIFLKKTLTNLKYTIPTKTPTPPEYMFSII